MNPQTPVRVLMVEDNPGDVTLAREMLRSIGEERIELLTANRVRVALEILAETRVDAVLLDLSLPDEHGLETLKKLRNGNETVPIVVLSGHEDEQTAFSALQNGAQDFLVKGTITGHLLTRSIFYAITRKEMESQLQHMAFHDALTGLPNRKLFYEQMHRSIEWADRFRKQMALFSIDLDNFKAVNESFGHVAGDSLLRQVAHRMRQAVRKTDTVARMGGDEFVVIFENVTNPHDLSEIVRKFINDLTVGYSLPPDPVTISFSVGISLYPLDGSREEELIRKADRAMHQAKENGPNQFRFYNSAMEQEEKSRRRIRNALSGAMEKGELYLCYQPKVNLRTGKVLGFEALVRWQDPELGLRLPNQFLPDIQGTETVVELGDWVLGEAIAQMERWVAKGLDLPVSVNVDVLQLKKPDFIGKLENLLVAHPSVLPSNLELEILETTAMEEFHVMREILEAVHAQGVRLALDDFGTGYSSLSHLKNLPVDTLKIDQSFVISMMERREDMAIIESISSLGKIFNIEVIAEGLERRECGIMLVRLGCEQAQGFAIAQPMPADEIPGWIRRWKNESDWLGSTNRQWEFPDETLLATQVAHLNWIQDLVARIGGPASGSQGRKGDNDPQECPVLAWFEKRGKIEYGHLPAFVELKNLYHEIRSTGNRLLEGHLKNDPAETETHYRKILGLKDHLLQKYAELQKERILTALVARPPS